MEMLTGLNAEGATIVMVTHSPSHADVAKRRIDMLDGQVGSLMTAPRSSSPHDHPLPDNGFGESAQVADHDGCECADPGAGTDLFHRSVGNLVLLAVSDQQYANAKRTYVITEHFTSRRGDFDSGALITSSQMTAAHLKEDFPELEAVARFQPQGQRILAVDGEPASAMLFSAQADPELLKIFNFDFIAGDPKTALQSADQIILTASAAKQLFGETAALGRHVVLDKTRDLTVSGVIEDPQQPSTWAGRRCAAAF